MTRNVRINDWRRKKPPPEFWQNLVNGLDRLSKNAGYNIFGAKAGNYIEALTRGTVNGTISYFIEKSGGIGKNDIYIPKINTSKISNILQAIMKNSAQEGGEEFAEYTVNKFADVVADLIFKGEVSFDFNLIEAFDTALTGSVIGGGFGGAQSFLNRNRTVNNLIKDNISTKEQSSILKNTYINITPDNGSQMYKREVSEIMGFPPKAKSSVEKKIKEVAKKAGVFNKDFEVEGVNFSFKMGSNNGFTKSMHNQMKYEGNYADLTKALLNIDSIISNAILLESHTTDKYKDTVRENSNFEKGCTLLGAFQDTEYITPVKITIKKEKGKIGNLYVVVAMDKIKRTDVMERGIMTKHYGSLSAADSVYKLSQIISNVNKNDSEFLKHIPDEMLSYEQRLEKNKAIQKEREKIEKIKKEN